MKIELDPGDERKLKALASRSGKDPGVLLGEIVREALKTRAPEGDTHDDEADLLARQRKALRDLHERMDTLPIHAHTDGLSGSRDHDAILYGKPAS